MKINNEYNKGLILTWISVIAFLLLIFGAAYAILGVSTTYDNSVINMAIGTRPIFTSIPSKTIALDIPLIGSTASEEYVIATDQAQISLSLSTNYSVTTECSYDIVWEWTSTDVAANQYHKTTGATKEYTVSGTNNSGQSFSEVQLNDYNSSNLHTLLYSGTIRVASGAIASQAWTITTNFYKTQAVQSNHAGKAYTGSVKVTNVVCRSVNA